LARGRKCFGNQIIYFLPCFMVKNTTKMFFAVCCSKEHGNDDICRVYLSRAQQSQSGKYSRARENWCVDVAFILYRVFLGVNTAKTFRRNGSVTRGRAATCLLSLPCIFASPCSTLFVCRV
jgi:hypothetical protein